MGLFGKKYKGITLETDSRVMPDFGESKLYKAIDALEASKINRISILPRPPISGCEVIRIVRDKTGEGLYAEIIFRENNEKHHFAKGRLSSDEAEEAIFCVIDEKRLPDLSSWKSADASFDPAVCLEIAKTISKNESFTQSISACFNSPAEYYKQHIDSYELRSIAQTDKKSNICWVGLADALIASGYAAEFAFGADVEEFVYFISKLAGRKGLPIDEKQFDKKDSVAVWCSRLDDLWRSENMCIGAMDIKNHSYITFIVDRDELRDLKKLAESIGQKINSPRNIDD